jgi:transposase
MVRRKLTIPERWQAVGMNNGGFNHRMVAEHFRVNHSIIVRLMQRFRQTKLYTTKISFRSQTQMLKSTRGTLHALSYTHK